MLRSEAIATFLRAVKDGRVTGRDNQPIGRGRQRVIKSHFNVAVDVATNGVHPAGADIELAPYLGTLAAFAALDEHGDRRPDAAQRVSSVRTVLATVEGRDRKSYKRRVSASAILSAWEPLYQAMLATEQAEGTPKKERHSLARYRGFLHALQDLAVTASKGAVRNPKALPGWAEIRAWADASKARARGRDGGAQKASSKRRWANSLLTAYRKAVALLPEREQEQYPDLDAPPHARWRGVRTLPNLLELLRARGCQRAPDDMETLEILDVLASEIARDVREYLEVLGAESRSDAWRTQAVKAASCTVASLVRLNRSDIDLSSIDTVHLFVKRVTVAGGRPSRTALRHAPDGAAAMTRARSLIRLVLEEVAGPSWARSHLQLADGAVLGDGDTAWYTTAVEGDVVSLFCCAEACHKAELLEVNAPRWEVLRAEYEAVKTDIEKLRSRRQVQGGKDKENVPILWPEATCRGLPALRRSVYEFRSAYWLARTRAEEAGRDWRASEAVLQARRAFHEKLFDFVLSAVLLDDGLRIKNYCNALHAVHLSVRMGTRGADGFWETIEEARSAFRGGDPRDVRLKVTKDENRKERKRRRRLRLGWLDPELLVEYLAEDGPRIDRLVEAGLLLRDGEGRLTVAKTGERYQPADDRFAFFPSDKSRKPTGAYSEQSLSMRFGKVLYWMATAVLGIDLPAWESEALQRDYRALWGAHVTRLLIATYWSAIRENPEKAMRLCNDTKRTIDTTYSKLGDDVADRIGIGDPTDPHWFDALIDRVEKHELIDWGAYDWKKPEAVPSAEGRKGALPAPRRRRGRPARRARIAA